jgi:hypothetical protein
LYALAGLGISVAGCGSSGNGDGPGNDTGVGAGLSRDVHTAFSGGGWRAHTAQAAWMMGMLDAADSDLDGVLSNVRSMSANSGGSWFLSHMAHSEPFRSSLEEDNAKNNYMTTGYLGQLKPLIPDIEAGCPGNPLGSICEKWFALRALVALTGGWTSLNWSDIVRDLVYGPFDMNIELADVPMSGVREAWAGDKTLIVAAAMLTEGVVLNQTGIQFEKNMYRAEAALSDVIPPQNMVTPAFFAGVGTSGHEAPAFFSAGPMYARYSSNQWGWAGGPGPAVSVTPLDADALVMSATTASSAAAAAGASADAVAKVSAGYPIPLTSAEIAYLLSDTAPAFDMGTAPMELVRQPQSEDLGNWQQLEKLPLVRMADGGYIDNTAVAYVLKHIQTNDLDDGFNIVAFVNTDTTQPNPAGAKIPLDFAQLFGEGSGEMCAGGVCLETIDQQVFDSTPLDEVEATWTYEPGGVDVELSYIVFPVVTVYNPSFGIEGGSFGTVHLFTSRSGVGAAPLGPDDIVAWGSPLNRSSAMGDSREGDRGSAGGRSHAAA